DAQSQRQYCHKGKTRTLTQLAEGEFEIIHRSLSVVSRRALFGGRIIRISDSGSRLRDSECVSHHSYLSASIGSTFDARRAGSQQASRAIATQSNATAINVAGSVGATPKRSAARIRENMRAATTPTRR